MNQTSSEKRDRGAKENDPLQTSFLRRMRAYLSMFKSVDQCGGLGACPFCRPLDKNILSFSALIGPFSAFGFFALTVSYSDSSWKPNDLIGIAERVSPFQHSGGPWRKAPGHPPYRIHRVDNNPYFFTPNTRGSACGILPILNIFLLTPQKKPHFNGNPYLGKRTYKPPLSPISVKI